MANLRLLHEETISSTVSTVQIPNVFTDDYDVYKIIGSGVETNNNGGAYMKLKFVNDSASTITTSIYDYGSLYLHSGTNTPAGEYYQNASAFAPSFFGDASGDSNNIVIDIYNSRQSTWTGYTSHSVSFRGNSTICYEWNSAGRLTSTDKVSGVEFSLSANSYDSGIFRIYGVRFDT
jgi:hypothetical protein